MQELVEQLESLCEKTGIEKFSAGEMVELLEDGEEIEWILDQIGQQAESPVGVLLQQIASEVAPEQSDVDDDEEVDGQEVEGDAGEDDFDPANLDMAELEGMLPPGVDMGQCRRCSPHRAVRYWPTSAHSVRSMGWRWRRRGEMNEAMQALHEEWLQTPRDALEGKKPAEMLEGGRLLPSKVETFRREEPKVGRNDPCPCGSGKKYKKCCAKAA